ncbi:MAG: hypothetical protein WD059_04055 [Balneolaceae bacterium]
MSFNKHRNLSFLTVTALLFFSSLPIHLFAQAEVMAWGNLNGIRIDGQLMEFRSTLCTPSEDWSDIRHTAKEAQYTDYERDGNLHIVTPRFDSLFFREEIEDLGRGKTRVEVGVAFRTDTVIGGAFFCLEFPKDKVASGGEIKISGNDAETINIRSESDSATSEFNGNGVSVFFLDMEVHISAENETRILVVKNSDDAPSLQVYFALIDGNAKKGQTESNTFTIQTDGKIDRAPVELTMDAENPGREFMGMGGNFRLQNANTDPQVIDYNLKNMRVAYARVEMPWMFWHQNEEDDPIAEAEAGNLHPRVDAAMRMAQRLHNIGMPVSIADWSGPDWAIDGERLWGEGQNGERGNPLVQEKINAIYKSIGDYIWYMKKHYGVEAEAFSFNESDLGINIRQTGEEHRDFIKGLGAHLAVRGLKTKLYLGDTADANGYEFTYPAMNDPETHKYISAVSFHSWRGWEDETLQQWRDISTELNIPVIIGEGSTDAAAWRYNDIFDEPTFAMHEINLYLRILDITQPQSILQWQLTADYSLLKGGGVFGNNEVELQPMQRFWNLKQLADTPENAFHLKVTNNSETITSTGFGDLSKGEYAVHVVNNGATRKATLSGIPEEIEELYLYITDQEWGMEQLENIPVQNRQATFTLNAWGFTSLFSHPVNSQ